MCDFERLLTLYLLSATFLFSAGYVIRLLIGDLLVSQVNGYFCVLGKKWHAPLLFDMRSRKDGSWSSQCFPRKDQIGKGWVRDFIGSDFLDFSM